MPTTDRETRLRLYKEYTELSNQYQELANKLKPFSLTTKNRDKFNELLHVGDSMDAKYHELLEAFGIRRIPLGDQTESWLEKIEGKKVKEIVNYGCDNYSDLGYAQLVVFVDGTRKIYCELGNSSNCDLSADLNFFRLLIQLGVLIQIIVGQRGLFFFILSITQSQ